MIPQGRLTGSYSVKTADLVEELSARSPVVGIAGQRDGGPPH